MLRYGGWSAEHGLSRQFAGVDVKIVGIKRLDPIETPGTRIAGLWSLHAHRLLNFLYLRLTHLGYTPICVGDGANLVAVAAGA